jgi:NAD(P)-dependent dehydrogenase (short-subunit alcohol dehydrogenase family)
VLAGVRLVRGSGAGHARARLRPRDLQSARSDRCDPGSRTPHYYAAKAALPNLAVGLAKELSGTGITVNTVSPGIIATDEVREMFRRRAQKRGWTGDDVELEQPRGRGDDGESLRARGTRRRGGRAGRVPRSRHAGYVNGANLRIDGGAADAACESTSLRRTSSGRRRQALDRRVVEPEQALRQISRVCSSVARAPA